MKNVSHHRAFSLLHSFRSSHIEYIHTYTLDLLISRVRRGRDCMVVGFTTTCAIIAFHHWSCEFESRSWRGVLYTALCDKVCQQLATGRWFSPGTPASSITKTGRHDIVEILLKVALTTINLTKPSNEFSIGPPLINSWSIPNEIRNLICKTKIVPNIWKRQWQT